MDTCIIAILMIIYQKQIVMNTCLIYLLIQLLRLDYTCFMNDNNQKHASTVSLLLFTLSLLFYC